MVCGRGGSATTRYVDLVVGLEADDGDGGVAVAQQEFTNIDREALPCLQVGVPVRLCSLFGGGVRWVESVGGEARRAGWLVVRGLPRNEELPYPWKCVQSEVRLFVYTPYVFLEPVGVVVGAVRVNTDRECFE